MLVTSFPQRRRVPISFAVLFWLGILSMYQWLPDIYCEYLPKWKIPTLGRPDAIDPKKLGLATLPEYNLKPPAILFCEDRYGISYLEKLHDTSNGLCTPESKTNITCFHSQTTSDGRVDMFCIAKAAVFDPTDRKFVVSCTEREISSNETEKGIPAGLQALPSYWYGTGPKILYDAMMKLDARVAPPTKSANYTILLKREGAWNVWHCLLEIWSMTMSIDILRTTIDPVTKAPFFSLADAENTQVLIIDDQDDGPYYDLWTLFARRPTIRLVYLPEDTNAENLILPLGGASNPLWQGDWSAYPCERSDLLHAFSRRVLDFYGIDAEVPHQGNIVLTYIDRIGTRRLLESKAYFQELLATTLHLVVQMIDFSALSFADQLRIVRETDILVGVHGAGLTHGMFLREGSVMVELLPEGMTKFRGFRNLAGLTGNTYLSAHASPIPASKSHPKSNETQVNRTVKRDDWHHKGVYVEKKTFMNLMEIAVKSLYNKGYRDFDI